MADGETGDRYVVALEEARRTLDQQKADLKAVRDRTAALLGFGGVAASFLGGLAIRDGASLSRWTLLASLAFAVLVILTVLAHRPYSFVFTQDAEEIVVWVEHFGANPEQVRRDLALHLFRQFLNNRKTMLWLWRAYEISGIVFLIELMALIADLKGR